MGRCYRESAVFTVAEDASPVGRSNPQVRNFQAKGPATDHTLKSPRGIAAGAEGATAFPLPGSAPESLRH